MNIINLIDKKRNKKELTKEELQFIVDGYINGSVKDYQMSSFLMAVLINGMTDQETIDLTDIYKNSGDTIDLSHIEGVKADKHSTGGLGDKTSLILVPLVASLGIKVSKLSGRGLGITGGTIDKLESIEGFNTDLTNEQFEAQLKSINCVIASQTTNLVPADKLIYALRSVTGTTDSIPLIAASIMSKKLATNADVIVLDVKVGSGAFLQKIEEARELASLMVKIGKQNNKKTVAIITNMDEPLGRAIGNSNEVIEAIEVLKGNGPSDLIELVLELAKHMIALSKNISLEEAYDLALTNLKNGLAYDKFKELVSSQSGDIGLIATPNKIISIKSNKTGVVTKIDSLKLGELIRDLGAGRVNKEDVINPVVGINLNKKVGDFVLENEELVKISLGDKDLNVNKLLECFEIENDIKKRIPLIIDVVF